MTRESTEFVISRTFEAPRALMWGLWTEREHLMHWFSPKGMAMVSCTNDLRPGGLMHYRLRGADGTDIWGKWSYREIVPPERLVFIVSFSDEQGGTTRHPFAPDWPLQMLTTVVFAESDGETTVTVQWVPFEPTDTERRTFDAGHESMRQGWGGTFEQLAEHVARLGR